MSDWPMKVRIASIASATRPPPLTASWNDAAAASSHRHVSANASICAALGVSPCSLKSTL